MSNTSAIIEKGSRPLSAPRSAEVATRLVTSAPPVRQAPARGRHVR
ncbi:hypothetical protein [Williamsia muralis]|uniref:Uncharacterized protein n=1 Tax=Williamsia marianensis TaxID=85044 RepID=A0ABU4EPC0_WILMA|nr:hypothetical protein [Williamsia muralis]MDV7133089.1 hypothetical protein [Williamsia muralis]